MKFRRHTPRFILCLTLGLVTTIAIAWTSAAFDNPPLMDHKFVGLHSPLTYSQYLAMRYNHRAVDRVTWGVVTTTAHSRFGGSETPDPPLPAPLDALAAAHKAGTFPCWWGATPDISGYHGEPLLLGVTQDARGWPVVALWCEWPTYAAIDGSALGGIDLSPTVLVPRENVARALPYRPIWRGLLADTLLFALAWSALLFAPRALRTHLRHRRGLCPRCAYNLAGLPPNSPCPECGRSSPQP